MKEIQDLIKISHHYGGNNDFVIAGGGNTSYKNDSYLWVKASGTSLAEIDIDGFIVCERSKIRDILFKDYSSIPEEREEQVKIDLLKSKSNPEQTYRPSVETILHEIVGYEFVVHTHPWMVNSILCSQKAEKTIKNIFGEDALFIEYTDPGYILSKKVENRIKEYQSKHKQDPNIIFLENHGIIVAADTINEIHSLYKEVLQKVHESLNKEPNITPVKSPKTLTNILPAVRMMLTTNHPVVLKTKNNKLIDSYLKNEKTFSKISGTFSPDHIVYCGSSPVFIEKTKDTSELLNNISKAIEKHKKEKTCLPKVLFISGYGIVASGHSNKAAETTMAMAEDALKISFFSENFGGPQFLDQRAVEFIESWDAEKYRKKINDENTASQQNTNKIAIVTGGAQGFGGGITDTFFKDGINVVIADLNKGKGNNKAKELNKQKKQNKAIFVKTDVSDEKSVESLIHETVKEFGGLDIFISNAGILKAGGLDEMDEKTFSFMTKVNYTGYFICSKYASSVLKLQSKHKNNYFTDIIQVNSKSGLKGSNKKFAYAGGKFGGVGLTQSFAMELMPHNIKVNSICPGNFFEGPLWSDPKTGLFTQYLQAGKVAGAKTIEDVKKYYESQVPAGRGCRVEDVIKAIYYVIEQQYETGQAIPVTGGQIMLK